LPAYVEPGTSTPFVAPEACAGVPGVFTESSLMFIGVAVSYVVPFHGARSHEKPVVVAFELSVR
jgi:hypothetical protein